MDNMPERRVSSHTEEHAHWKNSWSTLEFPNVVPTYKIVSMLFSSIALRHLICMMIKSSLKKRLTWDENKKKKKKKGKERTIPIFSSNLLFSFLSNIKFTLLRVAIQQY